MLDTFLPAALPSPAAVADLSPAAAEAIGEFIRFDAALPPRRSGEQINQLEELRSKALGMFDVEFFADLDVEHAKLRDSLHEELEQLRAHWARLETIRGLRRWRGQPQNFRPQPISVMTLASGVGGYRQPIYGRQVIDAIQDTVKGGS